MAARRYAAMNGAQFPIFGAARSQRAELAGFTGAATKLPV
jgi:hypothetical protein